MSRLCSLLLLLALVLGLPATQPAAADEASLEDVVATLEGGYRQLADLQVGFRQQTRIASLGKEEQGRGEFLLRRPDGAKAQFRFDYRAPRRDQIVCNGSTVWVYTPESKQVLVAELATLLEGGPGGALSHLTSLDKVQKDFRASRGEPWQDSKGDYQLQLVPRRRSQTLSRLTLTIRGAAVAAFRQSGNASEPFPLVRAQLFDPAKNRTTLEFDQPTVNQGLESERFSFTPPKGTAVVKPTK